MFTVALFIVINTWKQLNDLPKCVSLYPIRRQKSHMFNMNKYSFGYKRSIIRCKQDSAGYLGAEAEGEQKDRTGKGLLTKVGFGTLLGKVILPTDWQRSSFGCLQQSWSAVAGTPRSKPMGRWQTMVGGWTCRVSQGMAVDGLWETKLWGQVGCCGCRGDLGHLACYVSMGLVMLHRPMSGRCGEVVTRPKAGP